MDPFKDVMKISLITILFGLLALVMGLIGLLRSDPQAIPVLKFMIVLLFILSILALLWLAINRRKKRSTSQGNTV